MHRNTLKITYNFFEKKAWAEKNYVCGIDEVGRGALAGPLVVGAVILPLRGSYPSIIQDSKAMTAGEREKAYAWIIKHCWYTVTLASHEVIDKINIYQATRTAMKKAYWQLMQQLNFPVTQLKYVLSDAVPLGILPPAEHQALEFHHFNFADSLSRSVAAASIIAKVTRDTLMEKMDSDFPHFNFKQHKGYGTAFHWEALKKHGPSIIHRTTYLTSLTQGISTDEKQSSLF